MFWRELPDLSRKRSIRHRDRQAALLVLSAAALGTLRTAHRRLPEPEARGNCASMSTMVVTFSTVYSLIKLFLALTAFRCLSLFQAQQKVREPEGCIQNGASKPSWWRTRFDRIALIRC